MAAPAPKSRRRRILKRFLQGIALLLLILLIASGGLYWYFNPVCERTDGIIYGQRAGRDLTFDVVTPEDPNGLGIVLIVSGGWKSKPESFQTWIAAPLLRHGFTVLALSHISQPEVTIMEIVEDVHRAIRFIRVHAGDYKIDPARIGVTGGSAGGHLSLMLVTRGGPGPPDAADPVDRASSAVQAAAIFFPVTDLLNLGTSTENPGDGGPPRSFVKGFGPEAADLKKWKQIGHEISPIYHVRKDQPPVLIFHGDADTLTPLEQSEWFVEAAEKAGADVTLEVCHGKEHGWLTMAWDIRRMAQWFAATLGEKE